MTKFKYIIYIVAISCVTALISSGCESQRYTTTFQVTPMESVNEDLSIDPDKLTGELDEQMMIEDQKRRNKLLDRAKAEAEKNKRPVIKKTEEVK
ncbi:deoxycytidylate deaminase [Candidatus Scalindua japonica]|uniref:Deoxycytidylate deaminase n=1 Tax=Candidatus Scalindua japonica TaxID=1284222 RepID=A0A286TUR5_9BACT|nr:hypothetical protein [Candidatus Scalindua japonica]GAX59604.1 deoxycytidylate deaminase [Candidatus Scalindua japonica]